MKSSTTCVVLSPILVICRLTELMLLPTALRPPFNETNAVKIVGHLQVNELYFAR